MTITNGGSRFSIVGMIIEKGGEERTHITDDNKLQQYEKEIDVAAMANVDEMC